MLAVNGCLHYKVETFTDLSEITDKKSPFVGADALDIWRSILYSAYTVSVSVFLVSKQHSCFLHARRSHCGCRQHTCVLLYIDGRDVVKCWLTMIVPSTIHADARTERLLSVIWNVSMNSAVTTAANITALLNSSSERSFGYVEEHRRAMDISIN